MRETLGMLFRRFLVFAWDVRCDQANNNEAKLRAKLEWPYVMNSSVAMHRSLVSPPGFGTVSMHTGTMGITELAVEGLTNRLPCSEMIADNTDC